MVRFNDRIYDDKRKLEEQELQDAAFDELGEVKPRFFPVQTNVKESEHLFNIANSLCQQAMACTESFENTDKHIKTQMSIAVLSKAVAHIITCRYKDWEAGKEQVLSNLDLYFKEWKKDNEEV